MVRFKRLWYRRLFIGLFLAAILGAFAAHYVHSHPLIFNESFWEHGHCISVASFALRQYADDHHGKFPDDPNGYGDALLSVDPDCYSCLTGPGYDETPFIAAKRESKHLAEEDCGRVYIQGLTTNLKAGDSKIVLLFDKLPTPGGDHCHFLARLTAPLCREVAYANGMHEVVLESQWPKFAQEQIELLVNEGIDRREAERLYASQPIVPK